MSLLFTIKDKPIKTITHVMIWVAFLVLLLLFMPFYDMRLVHMPGKFMGLYALLIAYYYFNSMVLVPFLLAKKRFWEFVGITLVILVLYIFLSDAFDWLRPPERIHIAPLKPDSFPPGGPDQMIPPQERGANGFRMLLPPHFRFPYSSVLTFLLVFMVSTGIRIITSWFETERKSSLAEQEKSQAELSALKAQINPHFLFNTLNNLYHMAMVKSDETPATILKLADLMRFVLTETQAELIPLVKEVECINQYIDLQKLRLTDKTEVDFWVSGDIADYQLAPLLLLPFVENAFKYGVSTHCSSYIKIQLQMDEGVLNFNVENGKVSVPPDFETTGIGLNNVKRRLHLSYPEKYELIVNDEAKTYSVKLKINLK